MSHTYKPTIVVAAYNREIPLKRILKSISSSVFPDKNINLVISIDKSENDKVLEIANEFQWEWGQKKVIEHSKNLGLRSHILKCGDLTEIYDSIILLEDDLYVSPYFYIYAQKALNFYSEEERVAGISLYSHRYNETAFMRFTPLKDKHDSYFMQIPSSWGQAWSKKHWRSFRYWYDIHHTEKITSKDLVPPNVTLWPETSWKKYYFKYVIEENKYFVYPYRAFSTNCADVGTHHVDNRTCLQEPLEMLQSDYKFPEFGASYIVYDSHCELNDGSLKLISPDLASYDFEVDFYGTKDLNKVRKEFLITSKKFSGNPIRSFGRSFKPHEMNVVFGNEGSTFHLIRKEDAITEPFRMIDSTRNSYYYDIPEFLLLKSQGHIRSEDLISSDAKILSGYHELMSLKRYNTYKLFQFLITFEKSIIKLFSSVKD